MKKPKISLQIGAMTIVMDAWMLKLALEAKKVVPEAKKVMEMMTQPQSHYSFKNQNAIQNVLNAKHVLIVGAK